MANKPKRPRDQMYYALMESKESSAKGKKPSANPQGNKLENSFTAGIGRYKYGGKKRRKKIV